MKQTHVNFVFGDHDREIRYLALAASQSAVVRSLVQIEESELREAWLSLRKTRGEAEAEAAVDAAFAPAIDGREVLQLLSSEDIGHVRRIVRSVRILGCGHEKVLGWLKEEGR